MAEQPLKEIRIEGFTSIRSATVELGQLNVLVGTNGAGKSNFVQALGLLGRIEDNDLTYFVNFNGEASALLNNSSSSARIRLLQLDAPPNEYEAILTPAASSTVPHLDTWLAELDAR